MDTLYSTICTNQNTFCMCVYTCGGAFACLCICLWEAWGPRQGSSFLTPLLSISLKIYSLFIYVYTYVCPCELMYTFQIECLARKPQELSLFLPPHLWDYKYTPLHPTFCVDGRIQNTGSSCLIGACDLVVQSTHSMNRGLGMILHVTYIHTKSLPFPPKLIKCVWQYFI